MATQPWAGSGTATTVSAAVDVRSPSMLGGQLLSAGAMAIQNTGATNNLLVSFDNTNFLTVVPGQSLGASQVSVDAIYVKSSASTTTYEWLARDKEQN